MRKSAKYIGVCSLLLNLMPFVIYLSLIKPQKEMLTAALPFAVYYGFRHAGLLLFRDLEYNIRRLGWIGLISAIGGYTLGMFGTGNAIFWDLSGIGTGIASALFPAAVNQRLRLVKNDLLPATDRVKPLWQLLILLAFLAIITVVQPPALKFAIMLGVVFFAVSAYAKTPFPIGHPAPVRVHWFNYALGLILICAMLMLRLGRSAGIGRPVMWGLVLLLVFFVTMVAGLVLNRQHMLHYRHNLRSRLMLYGVCGQYWTLYSTIFIGAVYGLAVYYWTIVAYLLAFIFGGVVVKKARRVIKIDPHQVSLLGITLGILLTFWLPSYFVGVFLIRSFAGAERKNATADYEAVTHNYSISYIVNTYYYSAAGLISQLVMWGSLFLIAGMERMNTILGAYAFNQGNMQNAAVINAAHLVLAVYMIGYIVWLSFSIQKDKKQGGN